MPYRVVKPLCPICKQPGRLLDVARSPLDQSVDYYRCDPCEKVWLHHRSDPSGEAPQG